MFQTTTAEEKKLFSSFESIRRELQKTEFADRLDKPLAYWALPNDRRLPLAFLGRSIGDLVATPFDELARTRGVGQKKIGSLVKLLHRATSESPPSAPFGLPELAEPNRVAVPAAMASGEPFDPATISEAMWSMWCETVRRFRLEYVPLGAVATSLQNLPTVLWDAPLGDYAARSLMEIRQLRTHGEKRVRVVMEIFHALHQLLGEVSAVDHLAIRVVPAFVPVLETSVQQLMNSDSAPTLEDINTKLVQPILAQIRVDSGEMIHDLVWKRLGLDGTPHSVRDLAKELGVTRARIYQMLEDCAKVLSIRWPTGAVSVRQLVARTEGAARQMLNLVYQIFFTARQPVDEDEHWPDEPARD